MGWLVERYGLSAVRLIEEIRPLGYDGGIVTLRRFLQTLRAPAERMRKVTVRFETPPGKQGQVDWTEAGRFELASGKKLTVYAFGAWLFARHVRAIHHQHAQS